MTELLQSDDAARALANRDGALLMLDKLDAEERLLDFVRLMWPILEPGREMKEGWALRVMCEHLEAVADGKIDKLLINVPPGFMKSLLVDVFWPAWIWGPRRQAGKRFVSWSYHEALTVRDNRKCRQLVESKEYRELWGDVFKLADDQNEKKYYETDSKGFKFAAGIHGGGTGYRGDHRVVDDPHKVKEAESDTRREDANLWFTETYPTRKNDEDASSLVIMQRVHEHDVSGVILDEEAPLGYVHLCLPMEYEHDHPHLWTGTEFEGASKECLAGDPRTKDGMLAWPSRFPREEVDDLKRQLRSIGGDYAVAGQLQQRPVARGGGMFKRDAWQYVDKAPRLVRTVRGWDLAATKKKTSPRTAGVLVGICKEGRIFVLDCVADQTTDLEMETMLKAAAEMDGPGVVQDLPQDPGQAGKTQVAALKRLLHGHLVKSSTESGEKSDRARPAAAQQEGGNVYLVRGSWNVAFVAEAGLFPRGTFKDRIDAFSRAYARLVMKKRRKIGAGPEAL